MVCGWVMMVGETDERVECSAPFLALDKALSNVVLAFEQQVYLVLILLDSLLQALNVCFHLFQFMLFVKHAPGKATHYPGLTLLLNFFCSAVTRHGDHRVTFRVLDPRPLVRLHLLHRR